MGLELGQIAQVITKLAIACGIPDRLWGRHNGEARLEPKWLQAFRLPWDTLGKANEDLTRKIQTSYLLGPLVGSLCLHLGTLGDPLSS